MNQIALSQGKFALVDDEDFEWLNQWKWNVSGSSYKTATRKITVGGKRQVIIMSRLINNTPVGLVTDHINGDPFDNRRINLRTATNSQNKINSRIRHDNKSGCSGVHFYKPTKKWCVRIGKEGKRFSIGYYQSLQEAISIRKKYEKELHAEFARQ